MSAVVVLATINQQAGVGNRQCDNRLVFMHFNISLLINQIYYFITVSIVIRNLVKVVLNGLVEILGDRQAVLHGLADLVRVHLGPLREPLDVDAGGVLERHFSLVLPSLCLTLLVPYHRKFHLISFTV